MHFDASKQNQSPAAIDEDVLWRLSVVVRDQMGLDYTGDNRADLERGLRQAAADFNFHGSDGAQKCAEWLITSPLSSTQIDTLARYLTIGETYFFRDPALFESLRLHVWPALLQLRRAAGTRELRIWSAACCTGEEPYSIAMQLHGLLPLILPDWRTWKISILATDLNPVFLKKAEAAIYSAWSFRSAAREEQKRYFTQVAENRFQLNSEIRQYVRFAHLNLVRDVYPAILNGTSQQDIIFCRNVLMYFSPAQARSVASNLIQCLNTGGYLVPAASEASAGLFAPLISAPLPGVIMYQKTTAPQVATIRDSHFHSRQFQPKPIANLPTAKTTQTLQQTAPRPQPAAPVPAKPKDSAATAEEWHEKARQAAGLGHLDEALRFCDAAIAENKMEARYYYLRASILLEKTPVEAANEQQNEQQAEAALRRALYLESDFALAHFVLGNLERRRGKADAARRSWQNALGVLQNLPPDSLLSGGDDLTVGHAAAMIERALLTLPGSTTQQS